MGYRSFEATVIWWYSVPTLGADFDSPFCRGTHSCFYDSVMFDIPLSRECLVSILIEGLAGLYVRMHALCLAGCDGICIWVSALLWMVIAFGCRMVCDFKGHGR